MLVGCVALGLFAASDPVARSAEAATGRPASFYVPPPHHRCKAGYAEKTVSVRLRRHGRFVRVHLVRCLAIAAPRVVPHSYTVVAGQTLTVPASSGVLANASGSGLKAVLVKPVSSGALTLKKSGAFMFAPTPNTPGVVTFSYVAVAMYTKVSFVRREGHIVKVVHAVFGKRSKPALAAITVTPAASTLSAPPTIAVPSPYSAAWETSLAVGAPGVLSGDAAGLMAHLVSAATHGTVSLNADGSFTYIPASGYSGNDSFTFRAEDGSGQFSNSVIVTISVAPYDNITTTPALDPAFNPALLDYTIACGSSSHIVIQATVPPSQTLSVNGGPAVSGDVNQSVPLQVDQAFTFTLTTASGASTYDVRCTPADFPTWTAQRTGTPQTQWITLTPPLSPYLGGGLYAVIANSWGVPVWWMRAPAGSSLDNASVLPNGEVAWWIPSGATNDQTGDGQVGYYNVSTLAGASTTVTAASDGLGEMGANLHDFELLSNGNYLLIATVPRTGVNLTSCGVNNTNATVIDAIIQEVTPGGSLVWSWNTANHIGLCETDYAAGGNLTGALATTWNGSPAYDIIHMNSIQLVDDGSCLATQSCNIVFSARYLDAVYSLNMATGAINWKLGGTPVAKSLRFVGDPSANFSGQHFARILPNGTLTIFDNGTFVGRPPRAANYQISTATMTATLLSEVTDPSVSSSGCCGSASLLPGGDWLISWGANSLVTELTPSGNPVLTITFPSGSTYRAYPVADSNLINRGTLIAGMNAQFAALQATQSAASP
jgi:hypothetical protein